MSDLDDPNNRVNAQNMNQSIFSGVYIGGNDLQRARQIPDMHDRFIPQRHNN